MASKRVSWLTCASTALALAAACGEGSTAGSASAQNAGDGGMDAAFAGAGTHSGAAGSSGNAGAGAEACVDGTACSIQGLAGLCSNGTCQSCVDVDDDPTCVAAYGDGRLCIGGACIEGNCRTNADCGEELCTAHHCAGCTRDVDCPAETPICNVLTGSCVDAKQCAGVTPGDACPVNDSDVCCGSGPSAICLSGCCTDDNCGIDESCTAGICVSNTCPAAPADHHYYVDPSAGVPGNGSETCPIQTLGVSLQLIELLEENVSDSVTITLLDSIGVQTEGDSAFPFVIPANVRIEGTSVDTAIDVPPYGSGFSVREPGIELGNLTIRTDRLPNSSNAGVMVEDAGSSALLGGTLVIEGFGSGVTAQNGGQVALHAGAGEAITLTNNEYGLLINPGANATLDTTGGTIALDGNRYGFEAFGSISLTGEEGADLDTKSIVVSDNSDSGGWVAGTESCAISQVTFRDNGLGTWGLAGLALRAGTAVSVTNSSFFKTAGNTGSADGIIVYGPDTPLNVIHINYNYFHDNGTGLCVDSDVVGKNLDAKYNRWSSPDAGDDCAEAAPTRTVTQSADCLSGKNVGRRNGTITTVDVSNCAPLQIK